MKKGPRLARRRADHVVDKAFPPAWWLSHRPYPYRLPLVLYAASMRRTRYENVMSAIMNGCVSSVTL